ncbi:unnamed protein product [Gongylonema pulchrum]|uniref:Transcription initiation factor TFIID subunit 8 n=1 Tax=Gongylonema pulchrum TaxID=637853 RepID=A0A183DVJ3_9BILA|nr:unnamed protein product [Gongylonema pulchrum]
MERAKEYAIRYAHALDSAIGNIAKEEPTVGDLYDAVHEPIFESEFFHDLPDTAQEPTFSEPEPRFVERERAITPARMAAWRMKKELEEKLRKSPPKGELKENNADPAKKQKKVPVKITEKTRASALIVDEPVRAVRKALFF